MHRKKGGRQAARGFFLGHSLCVVSKFSQVPAAVPGLGATKLAKSCEMASDRYQTTLIVSLSSISIPEYESLAIILTSSLSFRSGESTVPANGK